MFLIKLRFFTVTLTFDLDLDITSVHLTTKFDTVSQAVSEL